MFYVKRPLHGPFPVVIQSKQLYPFITFIFSVNPQFLLGRSRLVVELIAFLYLVCKNQKKSKLKKKSPENKMYFRQSR